MRIILAEKLKTLRKKKQITQIQLADELGVSKGTVAMWETNKRKPNIIMLKRIAAVFGCTTDELLESIEV